jgi:hypothetical protein
MRLTNTDEENLGIFERKVLRKIAGPRRTEEGEYRILMNHEIRDIIEGEDIVGFVKAQRLRWFGHVQRRDTQHILRKNPKLETSRRKTKRQTKDKVGRPDTRGH